MESMSNCPHYLPHHRKGSKYGHQELLDGVMKDGLWDAYDKILMGEIAEICADEHGLSRKDQDEYAELSYSRAISAQESGLFKSEIVPVEVHLKGKKIVISEDEEPKNVHFVHCSLTRVDFMQRRPCLSGMAP
jgi:acetyl-CoA C-acetyltransferase